MKLEEDNVVLELTSYLTISFISNSTSSSIGLSWRLKLLVQDPKN